MDGIKFPNLGILRVASNYIAKKITSENTTSINRQKTVKLWHQPSKGPTVRVVGLKGRKRNKKCAKRAKLGFCSNVKVIEIPSRHEYSRKVKSQIWRGQKEIRMNAMRNYFEFDSEGREWRTVVEEKDMYVHTNTGQLIHPCWVERENSSDVDSSDDEEVAWC